MPPNGQNYAAPDPMYQREPLDVSKLPTGLRLDPHDRDQLLERLAAEGRVCNAKDIPPPPPPPPKPVTILYPFLLAIFPAWTYGLQGRGDCMAWSATHSVDHLMAVNIALLRKPERATALACIEAQYGLMRVEVYGGAPDYGGDGGSPSAAAESLLRCGSLHRLEYLDNKYDLRTYDQSGGRSGEWGRYGIPDQLEPAAREHLVKDIALVTDFDSAVNLLSQGIPISNAHQKNPIPIERDREGFASKHWAASHAMNYIGYRLGSRPGLLNINSGHGNHVAGAMKPDDCPQAIASCAAWLDADLCNNVLKAEWSWAYLDYTGFPRRELTTTAQLEAAVHPNELAA